MSETSTNFLSLCITKLDSVSRSLKAPWIIKVMSSLAVEWKINKGSGQTDQTKEQWDIVTTWAAYHSKTNSTRQFLISWKHFKRIILDAKVKIQLPHHFCSGVRVVGLKKESRLNLKLNIVIEFWFGSLKLTLKSWRRSLKLKFEAKLRFWSLKLKFKVWSLK